MQYMLHYALLQWEKLLHYAVVHASYWVLADSVASRLAIGCS